MKIVRLFLNLRRAVLTTLVWTWVLLMTSCQIAAEVVDGPTPSGTLPTQIQEDVSPLPSATLTTTPVSTSTRPINTPTAPAPTATATPIPSLTLTPTPIITLQPDAAHAYVAELLTYDAACRLPCWWGAIPGDTRWAEVYPLLVSLDALIYQPDDPANGLYTAYLPHIPNNLTSDPLGLETSYSIEDGTIKRIWVTVGGTSAYYLQSILANYGPPSGIRLQSQPFTPTGDVIFRIVLLYEDQGFAAQITTNNAWVSEDRVVACLTDDVRQGTSLFMWVPGAFSGFSRIAQVWSIGQEPSTYASIENATGMDVQTFFETYAGPDGETCITTPVEIWE